MYKNPKDIAVEIYTVDPNQGRETISWCRNNFGDRTDGWDFSGGHGKVTLYIWNSRLKFMYEIFKT